MNDEQLMIEVEREYQHYLEMLKIYEDSFDWKMGKLLEELKKLKEEIGG